MTVAPSEVKHNANKLLSHQSKSYDLNRASFGGPKRPRFFEVELPAPLVGGYKAL